MKSETLKLSGLQEEMNKNNELKDDVDAIKTRELKLIEIWVKYIKLIF